MSSMVEDDLLIFIMGFRNTSLHLYSGMCHAPTGRRSRLAYRRRLAPWSPPSTRDLLPLLLAASDDLLGMRRNIVSKFLSTSRPRLRCGDGFRTRSMSWYGRKWSTLSFLSLSRPTQLISSSPHSLTCDSIRRERQHLCVKPRSRRFPIAAGK